MKRNIDSACARKQIEYTAECFKVIGFDVIIMEKVPSRIYFPMLCKFWKLTPDLWQKGGVEEIEKFANFFKK